VGPCHRAKATSCWWKRIRASFSDLLTAVKYAASYSGVSVVSMSWEPTNSGAKPPTTATSPPPSNHTGVTFIACRRQRNNLLPSVSSNVLSSVAQRSPFSPPETYSSETAWRFQWRRQSSSYDSCRVIRRRSASPRRAAYARTSRTRQSEHRSWSTILYQRLMTVGEQPLARAMGRHHRHCQSGRAWPAVWAIP